MPRHHELPGSYESQILYAKQLAEERRFVEAKEILAELLIKEFLDPQALYLWAYIEEELQNYGIAANIYRRVIDILNQTNASKMALSNAWANLGHTLHQLWAIEQAIWSCITAIEYNPNNDSAYINLAAAHLAISEPETTKDYALQALTINPESIAARDNLSIAQLFLHEWEAGWTNYEISLGYKYRKEWVYGDETRWNGEKGKNVVFYGEQGLGDEILFASCLPEAIEDCKNVIVDCDHRLEGLFKRSFPDAHVFGTRTQKSGAIWDCDIDKIDHRCSLGSLPKFYRTKDEDFPRTPYLVSDPDRRTQWRALLDSKAPDLKVGLAWTGGVRQTGRVNRCIPLEDLAPLFELPVFWVSLEYLKPDTSGTPIYHWDRGVDTEDYDDTAALVSELDLVIAVPTTVVHLAGALGKECWCLVPKYPNWRFGFDSKNIWHDSVRHIRQEEEEEWKDVIQRVKHLLERRIGNLHRDGSEAPGRGNGLDLEHPKTQAEEDTGINPADVL